MSRIPLGNFGFRSPGVTQAADTSPIGAAVERLGGVVQQIGDEEQARRVAVARGRAGNAVLDHRIQVDQKVNDIEERVRGGTLSYEDARSTFDKEMAQQQPERIDHLDPVGAEGMDRGIKQNSLTGANAIDRLANAARRQDLQSQFSSGLDKLGKLAGAPGADIESLNQQADAFEPLAIAGGVPKDQVTRALQNFKDGNWFNHAQQRAMNARNDLAGLKTLAGDLTAADGFYSGKLDTDKRNALLRGVQGDQDRLVNRAENLALRREARADRVLAQVDRQIASGVPATAQMWADWESQVKGTPQAGEFTDRVKAEQQVQEVLRQPVADQVQFVQQQEAALMKGGTLAEAANLTRLKEAVKRNVTLLQESPLLFQQNRTGTAVEPINFADLGSEEGAKALSGQLHDRVLTLDAMRKQYGEQVQMRPLLPQEAQMLGAALESSTPKQMASVFGSLREAVGDDQMFMGIMQQIAPDSPVRAVAGSLAAKQRSLTLERNWMSDDVVASSRDVAGTILAGEQILNRSKASKGQDGKPDKGLFMPGDQELQDKFKSAVGAAFANRPGAADVAFQVVKAYYAGKAAQNGRIAASSQDVDTNIVREAITASLGNVIDYNGKGEVIAPWGMGEHEFDAGVHQALEVAARSSADPALFRDRASLLGLSQRTETSFYLRSGRSFVTDAQGQPIVIDVANPTAAARRGEIKR